MNEIFPLERAAKGLRAHDERQSALPRRPQDRLGKLIRLRERYGAMDSPLPARVANRAICKKFSAPVRQ